MKEFVSKFIKHYFKYIENLILDKCYHRNSLINKITIQLLILGTVLVLKWYFYTKSDSVYVGIVLCTILFVSSVAQSFNKYSKITKNVTHLVVLIFTFLISIVFYHVFATHFLFICISFLYACTFFNKKYIALYTLILIFSTVFVKDLNRYFYSIDFLDSQKYNTTYFSNFISSLFLYYLFYTFVQYYKKSIEFEKNLVKNHNKLLIESQTKLIQTRDFREKFFSNITHHIRTPMNAISGFTDMLKTAQINQDKNDYYKAIENSVNNINNLLNQLIENSIAYSEREDYIEKEINIRDLLENNNNLLLNTQWQNQILSKIKIDENLNKTYGGDESKISFVILNLLSFISSKAKNCELTIEAISRDILKDNYKNIEFRITCSDIYFNTSTLSYLLGNSTIDYLNKSEIQDSSFLSLGLIPFFVKLLKGHLNIIENKNGHCEISFIVPVLFTPNSEITKSVIKEPIKALNGYTILIVEDNMTNMLVLKNIIEKLGAKTLNAINGKSAVDILSKQNNIDCVLMDLAMPEMDGIEATEIIRKKFKMKVPIIIITANSIVEDINRCYKAGSQKVLNKPLEEDKLLYNILNYSMK